MPVRPVLIVRSVRPQNPVSGTGAHNPATSSVMAPMPMAAAAAAATQQKQRES